MNTVIERVLDALKRPFVALIIVILAAGLPRIMALDRFVTTDERLWLTRSANFYCAISQGDWKSTFQRPHPGVTVTWAGLLGFLVKAPGYSTDCRQIEIAEIEQSLHALGIEPIKVLQVARFFMVLFNVSALAAAFLYARRLIGPLPAFVGLMFIAFDPFHIALSRLLHLDGLVSSLMLLALLAFLSYLHSRRAFDLVISGLAAGLSWLTKSPGLLLIPFTVLLEFLHYRWDRKTTPYGAIALWGAVAVVMFVALWPAMWVDPTNTVAQVLDMAKDYASEGHSTPLFFAGKLYGDGQIGVSVFYFYPITYLWRSTPISLVGILAALVALVFKRDLVSLQLTWRTVIELAIWSLVFTAMVNFSAKKFDRYLLPVYAPLDLISAVGWVAVARWLSAQRIGVVWRCVSSLVLGGAFLVQAMVTLPTFPYYLSYYNPLMPGKASDTMMIGWGEGLDQAARYLNQKPDARQLHVVSWYASGCFSYFFHGSSEAIPLGEFKDIDFQEALNADYVVIYYTQQAQRHAAEQLLNYLAGHDPEHIVRINGLEYARIYRMNTDIRTEAGYRRADVVFGNQIGLDGYSISSSDLEAGQAFLVSLSWQVLEAPGERLKVFIHMLDSSGRLVAQHDGEPIAWHSLTDSWQPGDHYIDRHGIALPPDLSPGEYTLLVGMYRYSSERLMVIEAGQQVGDTYRLGKVSIH